VLEDPFESDKNFGAPAMKKSGPYKVLEDPMTASVYESGQVSVSLNFFPSFLTTRPNKLERLSLESLSSQILDFEGKARANQIGTHFRCILLG
jgi:hypothetical protein